MNVGKPLKREDYEKFYKELYREDPNTKQWVVSYSVALDADPTVNIKALSNKLSKVQMFKDRVLFIFNEALKNESFWNHNTKKLEDLLEAEEGRQILTETVSKGKSADTRVAMAHELAVKSLVDNKLKGAPYDDKLAFAKESWADAKAFLKEVENIYENLNSTDQNLVRQIKTIMIVAKVNSGGLDEDPDNVRASVETL